MNNVKKTLATATFALSSIVATAIIPATSVIGTSVAMTGLMAISSPAQAAQQCGGRIAVRGTGAVGAFYKARKRRAEKRAKRAWRNYINGGIMWDYASGDFSSKGLGTSYSDLSNAKDVKMNCTGYPMKCTVTATPCTKS